MVTPSSVGFAIGNGISREGFDLDRLRGKGTSIGCNWLFQDWEPDYLVALDVPMCATIREHIESDAPRRWKFLTRGFDEEHRLWLLLEDEPVERMININDGYNNYSGVIAAAYLTQFLECEVVYLIGIDFFLPVPGPTYDMYSTVNRPQAPGHAPVWNLLAKKNLQSRFVRVGPIADYDRDFYYNKLKGFEFIESLEGTI